MNVGRVVGLAELPVGGNHRSRSVVGPVRKTQPSGSAAVSRELGRRQDDVGSVSGRASRWTASVVCVKTQCRVRFVSLVRTSMVTAPRRALRHGHTARRGHREQDLLGSLWTTAARRRADRRRRAVAPPVRPQRRRRAVESAGNHGVAASRQPGRRRRRRLF